MRLEDALPGMVRMRADRLAVVQRATRAEAEAERLRGLLSRALSGLECDSEAERREVWHEVVDALDHNPAEAQERS